MIGTNPLYDECHPKVHTLLIYSKTCLKQPLKNRQNKGLDGKWLLNEG